MNDSDEDTRNQSSDEINGLPSRPAPVFAAGEAVPNLSSWLLERKLGGGGFGEVWLAKHAWNTREKPRAVKFCTDPVARRRLVTHERNVVLRVMKYAGDHPNVVPLLDCNLDGDIPWLMYEFVEGGTLASAIVRWRPLPAPERLDLVMRTLHSLASALGRFHRFDPPLVHRDMKPQNVLMAGAVPRITDFGIGSVVLQSPTDGTTDLHTAYAARMPTSLKGAGTRLYAPPEQQFGATPNPRDDVYALGIIAYQMITADLATGPGADAALELRDLKIPDEFAALVTRSAALDPNRRPKDATEWESALSAFLQNPQKRFESVTGIFGSQPILLPEPETQTGITDRVPGDSAPPTESSLFHTELPPEVRAVPKPVVEPARDESAPKRPSSTRRFVPLVIGSALLLGSIAGSVYLFLNGNKVEPTAPTESVETPTNDPKTGPFGSKEDEKAGKLKNEPKDPPEPKVDPKSDPPAPKIEPKGPPPPPKVDPPAPVKVDPRDIEIANGVKMTFCWVPAGKCQLGSPKAERDAVLKVHGEKEPEWLPLEAEEHRKVFVSTGFWMGKYPVTQGEWKAVMGTNPSSFNGTNDNKAKGMQTGRFPVESVSWDMICERGGFLEKANAHGGIQKVFGKAGKFTLPHEDMWEYACRGDRGDGGNKGNEYPFYFGKELNGHQANCNGNFPFGTPVVGPYLGRPTSVGNYEKFVPHPWGLCDMHGNVWQWCVNSYDEPISRVLRGGYWNSRGYSSRAAHRHKAASNYVYKGVGFRVVITGVP